MFRRDGLKEARQKPADEGLNPQANDHTHTKGRQDEPHHARCRGSSIVVAPLGQNFGNRQHPHSSSFLKTILRRSPWRCDRGCRPKKEMMWRIVKPGWVLGSGRGGDSISPAKK